MKKKYEINPYRKDLFITLYFVLMAVGGVLLIAVFLMIVFLVISCL